MSKKMKKKHPVLKTIFLSLLFLSICAGSVFLCFGGFSLGETADPNEVKIYAQPISTITIPEQVRIIALGEATHGNAEFHQLKMDVFQLMVQNYGVRSFVLEGDFGGCEAVDRYIHGGEGNAKDAAAAIGFPIYRTPQMAALIGWMRKYNETAAPGDDLRFYGNDMQRCGYNCRYLAQACDRLGIDASEVAALADGNDWNADYDHEARLQIVTDAKVRLTAKNATAKEIHFADILLQNLTLGGIDDDPYQTKMMDQRAAFMSQNVQWVLEQEKAAGRERIFLTAHNGHVARYSSVFDMGSDLQQVFGDAYYPIGTGYYKTTCNLPVKEPSGKRTKHTVYSHDPIGNGMKKAGLVQGYFDFDLIPETSPLYPYITGYHYLGSLGEGFSILHRLLPMSTREFQPPATLFCGMIYVTAPTPTVIE